MTIQQQLERDEGIRIRPYSDSVGKVSIGIGRNLSDVGVSDDEIELMFQNDIKRAQNFLTLNLPWVNSLDAVRQAAFINLAFNLQHNLLQFRQALLAAQAGDWTTCKSELLDSLWARQVGDRATRIAQQLETGEWV